MQDMLTPTGPGSGVTELPQLLSTGSTIPGNVHSASISPAPLAVTPSNTANNSNSNAPAPSPNAAAAAAAVSGGDADPDADRTGPRSLNAFDLINMVSGQSMNNMLLYNKGGGQVRSKRVISEITYISQQNCIFVLS